MSRNEAFEDDDGENSQKHVDEVSSVKVTHTDGAQLSRFVRKHFPKCSAIHHELNFKADKVAGLNINDYATRKTLAQGMLDLALLTANAAQLRRVLIFGPENRFYYFLVTLISISLILQVIKFLSADPLTTSKFSLV